MSTSTRLCLAMVALLWSADARADLIRPPPDDCVPGSEGRSGHSGPYCAPAVCGPECKGTRACEARKLCLVKKTLGGGRRPRDTPRPIVDSVVGSCDRGKKCERGECKAMRVCVVKARKSENPIEAPIRRAGCGCSVGDAGLEAGGALALLLVGGLVLRRRRR